MATLDEGKMAQRAAELLQETGIESAVTGELYTTNGNHFAAAGIPTIVAGPGDIAQAHTPDEWIELEQLELGVMGYLALMNGL
jgi:acetylornithine deacetylase